MPANSCRLAVILLTLATFLTGRAAAESTVALLDVPAPAGSVGPNLVARDGILVLSWMEPFPGGHRLLYSTLESTRESSLDSDLDSGPGGHRWSEPREVAAGADWFVNWADFPSVVPLDGSSWAAHWLVQQPAGGYAYDIYLSLSVDAGRTWSEPVISHDDGTATEHGFVSLFPQGGGAGLIWLDGRKMAGGSHGRDGHGGMTLRYGHFYPDRPVGTHAEIDGLVCDCCQTGVAIAESGPVAVYRNRTPAEVRDIYVTRLVDGAWEPGRAVADDGWTIAGCPVNGPGIAADGASVAVAWFTAADHGASVRLSRSHDSGATFDTPVTVADGRAYGRAGVALLPDGATAVSWLCRGRGGTGVCIREFGHQDTGQPGRLISGDDRVPPLSVPQLARYGNDLVAAWTAERDGATIVRSARITRPDRVAAN